VPHPSLLVFLDKLKEEAAKIDVDLTQDVGGRSPLRKKAKTVTMESNTQRIVARYETHKAQDDIKSYLKGIGSNISGNLVD